MCTRSHVYTCVEARNQRQVSSFYYSPPYFFSFETGSLTAAGTHNWARLTGQGVSGIYLSLPPTPPSPTGVTGMSWSVIITMIKIHTGMNTPLSQDDSSVCVGVCVRTNTGTEVTEEMTHVPLPLLSDALLLCPKTRVYLVNKPASSPKDAVYRGQQYKEQV